MDSIMPEIHNHDSHTRTPRPTSLQNNKEHTRITADGQAEQTKVPKREKGKGGGGRGGRLEGGRLVGGRGGGGGRDYSGGRDRHSSGIKASKSTQQRMGWQQTARGHHSMSGK